MAGSAVVIKILGDAKNFNKELKGSQARVDKFGQQMGRTGRTASRRLTLPILAAGAAILGLGIKAGENADRLLDMSAQTGISTDKLQEYEFVAGQAGVSTDFFKKSAEEVIKTLDRAKEGIGPAAEAYEQLGVSVLDSNGKLRDAGTITEEVMAKLAAIEDPTLRAALAQDIFKGANQDMLAVLSLGTDEIDKQRKAAHDLGAVQSGDALEGANKFRMGMENLKSQIGGIVGTLGAEFAPLLSDVVLPLVEEHVVPAIRSFAEFVGALSDKFQNLNPRMKGLIGGLIGAAAVAGPLLIAGSKMIKMFSGITKAFAVLTKVMMANPWLLLIAAIIALVILIVVNWDKIKAYLGKVWDWMTDKAAAVGDWFMDTFGGALEFLKNLFLNFTGPGLIIKHFDTIRDAVTAIAKWLKDTFFKALDFVKNLFLNFTGPGLLIKHWDKIKDTVTGVGDWVRDKFTAMIDFLRGLPAKVTSAIGDLFGGVKTAFKRAMNFIIDAWNRLDIEVGPFSIPSWVPGVGGKSFHIADVFPDLPRMHGGGIFRAPIVGGEGLAILRDQERISAAGAGGMGGAPIIFAPQIGTLIGEDGLEDLFDMFRGWMVDVQRRNVTVGFS